MITQNEKKYQKKSAAFCKTVFCKIWINYSISSENTSVSIIYYVKIYFLRPLSLSQMHQLYVKYLPHSFRS